MKTTQKMQHQQQQQQQVNNMSARKQWASGCSSDRGAETRGGRDMGP